MKNISCYFNLFLLFFFCTSLLGDAEMMHKLHVLQYPGLSNMTSLVTLTHTHTRWHTLLLSLFIRRVSSGWRAWLIGCEAAVASPVYTSLERGQH